MSRGTTLKADRSLKEYREAETWLVPRSRGAGLRVGLVYPAGYYVGMSSLGYQLIYRLLAARSDLLVERLFYPGPRVLPKSVETERPAGDFDVLAFSCAYEPEYLGLIRFLLQSGIEPLSERRPETAPLLLAGGIAVTANPAPLARLLDGFLLGDGEEVLGEAFDRLAAVDLRSASRESVLQRLGEVDSLYLPALHGVPAGRRFTRRVVKTLDDYPAASAIVTRHTDLSEMLLLEVARGCARGCHFCLTGHFNGRLRLRSPGALLEQVDAAGGRAGKVGLIASEIACHPGITGLCESLVSRGLEISTSSLEIDRVGRVLLDLLVRGGQRTLTLAPETGEESRRFALGKRVADEELYERAAMAAEAGIERLRLYFIVGMPQSPEEEVEALVRFLKRTREAFFAPQGGRARELIASLASFVPKPHTPWAHEPMLPERDIKRRLACIRREVGRLGGVRVTSQSPRLSALDAMIALGDASVGPILAGALREGASPREVVVRLGSLGAVDPYRVRPPFPQPAWGMVETG